MKKLLLAFIVVFVTSIATAAPPTYDRATNYQLPASNQTLSPGTQNAVTIRIREEENGEVKEQQSQPGWLEITTIDGTETDVVNDIIDQLRSKGWICRHGMKNFAFGHRKKYGPTDRKVFRLTLRARPHLYYQIVAVQKNRTIYYCRGGDCPRRPDLMVESSKISVPLVELDTTQKSSNAWVPLSPAMQMQRYPSGFNHTGGYF